MKTISDIPIGPKALYNFRQSGIEDFKELIRQQKKLAGKNNSTGAAQAIVRDMGISAKLKYIKEKFDIKLSEIMEELKE